MKRDGIIIYVQQYEAIKDLSQSDKGLLLDAIFHYHITGEVMQELPPMVLMAFTFIRTSIDSNTRKYEAIVERNRENGKKGGRPRNPNNPSEPKKPTGLKKTQANPNNPSEPKKADTDTVTDTVKDKKIKTESIDDLFSNENVLLKPIVSEWIAYKKEIKDPYKTVRGMKAFVKELQKLSNNDPKVAKEITERSMANNWKGIFELNNNGNGKTAITTSRARQKLD
ncbi:DUF6291 domain-containing protein [Lascolabacillus massiliensis]|uniref:DUF6291 domain-containing protein n=1 Tax=Lascolabacillus massiliensis TaxID=1627894 RepID=UPI0006B38105|nr:DUF6291 domain-containing protein [Lascolabacillus massiliensis]